VWDLLEAPDDQRGGQSARLERSWSHPSDDGAPAGGPRRLSLKKLFTRTLRRMSRPSEQQAAATWQTEPAGNNNDDDGSSLTERVVASIPSTEIDLANYIVAHGILSKELRSLAVYRVGQCDSFCRYLVSSTGQLERCLRMGLPQLHFVDAVCIVTGWLSG